VQWYLYVFFPLLLAVSLVIVFLGNNSVILHYFHIITLLYFLIKKMKLHYSNFLLIN
jgi:hypothetical protein